MWFLDLDKKNITIQYLSSECKNKEIIKSSITFLGDDTKTSFTQVWCGAKDPFCNKIEGSYLERVEFLNSSSF
ncbi:MAG: hypothetical protein GXO61_01010 [Epsilonproteobacteria bacterium]|nr:hypothetical protein [Campylobacterota bacterium]